MTGFVLGILLCAGMNLAFAEYALACTDNSLFASKYMLDLPKKEDMQAFIEDKAKELGAID